MKFTVKFNDILALVVVIGCLLVAIGEGLGWLKVPDYVLGALFSTGFTLVIQFYFRKKEGE